MRKCCTCKVVKEDEEFYNPKTVPQCKVCAKEYQRNRFIDNPCYGPWSGMMKRCYYPKNMKYADYGGRGITVCERWKVYENFCEDMSPRPSSKHEIDRKDNNGNYEPNNCRWVTRQQNNQNTCRTRLNDFRVKILRLGYATGIYTHKFLADYFGVEESVAQKAINGKTWSNIASIGRVIHAG